MPIIARPSRVPYSVVAYIVACGKTLELTLDAQIIAIELFERVYPHLGADLTHPVQLLVLACVNLAAKTLQRYPKDEDSLKRLVNFPLSLSQLHFLEHKILFLTNFQIFSISEKSFRSYLAEFFAAIADLLSPRGRSAVASALEATAVLVCVFPGLALSIASADGAKLAALLAVHAAASFTRKEKLKDSALVRKLLLTADKHEDFFAAEFYPLARDFINFVVS